MINENKSNTKENSNLEEEANIKKYLKYGEILKKNVVKNIDNKLISKTGMNIFNKEINKNAQNFISFPVTEKNIAYLTIKNNTINIKKSDIPLPRLNKLVLKRQTNSLERHKNTSLYNNATPRMNPKLTINNKTNFSLLYNNSLMNKEENKSRNNSNNNKIIFNSDFSNTSRNKNFMKIPKNFKFHKISRNSINPELNHQYSNLIFFLLKPFQLHHYKLQQKLHILFSYRVEGNDIYYIFEDHKLYLNNIIPHLILFAFQVSLPPQIL